MRLHRAIRLSALLLLSGSITSLGADPPTFPLVCRGGGPMRVQIQGASDGTLVFLHFDRAPEPVAGRAPGAGQCGWVDRVLRDDEPTAMYYLAHMSYPIVVLGSDGRLRSLDYDSRPTADRPSLQRVRRLVDGAMNQRSFTAHVRRLDVSSGPVFVVEGIEY